MEKIILEKGDKLFIEENLFVINGGEFEPQELVLVGYEDMVPIYQFQANYIKKGEML